MRFATITPLRHCLAIAGAELPLGSRCLYFGIYESTELRVDKGGCAVMFWCSDPSPGILRLHGYPSDRSIPQRPRPVHTGTVQTCPQLDGVAFLFRVRRGLRNVGALLSQVVNRPKGRFSQFHVIKFIAGALALLFFSGPISAADISDITFQKRLTVERALFGPLQKQPGFRQEAQGRAGQGEDRQLIAGALSSVQKSGANAPLFCCRRPCLQCFEWRFGS